MQHVHGHLSRWCRHHRLCWSSHSCGPWCPRIFHCLGCHGHQFFPVILTHINVIHVPVPCHSSSATLQLLHIFLLHSFSMKLCQVVFQLTYTTFSLVRTTSVAPGPITALVSFSMATSTCF